jgi:hypothetical protein
MNSSSRRPAQPLPRRAAAVPSGAGEGECGTLKNSLNTNPGALDYQTIKLYPPRTTFSEAAIPYLRVSLPRSEAPAGQATRYSEVRAYVVYAKP